MDSLCLYPRELAVEFTLLNHICPYLFNNTIFYGATFKGMMQAQAIRKHPV